MKESEPDSADMDSTTNNHHLAALSIEIGVESFSDQ